MNIAINEADNNTTKNSDRFRKTLKDKVEKLKIESQGLLELAIKEKYLSLKFKVN